MIRLVFRGRLEVDAVSYPLILWRDTEFVLHPVSPWAVWVDLHLSTSIDDSGAFELRADCRRMPQSALDDDEHVLQTIRYWTHVGVTVSHPLLKERRIDVAVEPWPPTLRAGPDSSREFDIGRIGLQPASGVLAEVVTPDGTPAVDAVAALYVLNGDGEIESSIETQSVEADEKGRFFIHHLPGVEVLVVATSEGLVPFGKRLKLEVAQLHDLGRVQLDSGERIAGRVDSMEDYPSGDRPAWILVDGYDQPIRNSREITCQSFALVRTLENFYWDGTSTFRIRCRAKVQTDGSFISGGLSKRCHRIRVAAPLRGRNPQLFHQLVAASRYVWTVECAPASNLLLRPSTATIHVRVVRPASEDPRLPRMDSNLAGTISWTDELGRSQSTTHSGLDDTSIEVIPLQAIEVRVDGDPTGRVHRLSAPGAGRVTSYDIEVPRMSREGG